MIIKPLNEFDVLLKAGLSRITNCDLSEFQWLQASLPVREGGIGVRGVSKLALSAFLASAAGTQRIQDQILSQCSIVEDHHVAEYKSIWSTLYPSASLPEPPLSFVQSSWDKPAIIQVSRMLVDGATDVYSKARLLQQ